MDKVAQLDAAHRRELFSETAARMNIPAGLIEKDFWVCWTLKHLFSIPAIRSHILFKGGTTLSKIFGVIERFSEDIDLAVDWEILGFTGERSPQNDMSAKRLRKLLKEMREDCKRYIATDFLDVFRKRVTDRIPDIQTWQIEVDPDDGQVVNFSYPMSTDLVGYVRPIVRLELGTHAEFIPNDRYSIRPYAAEQFPGHFEEESCPLRALKAERTFWEKATILHQEHYRDADRGEPARFSRHYYDVFMLSGRDDITQAALGDPGLLARVVEHKKRFFPRKWARYDLAEPASLQLQPSPDWIDYLRRDYENMKIMFFGVVPSFDDILLGLERLEDRIRRMAPTT